MDLHDAFADWLAAGPEGEPTRDLAIHASGCDECMRAVATLESLRAVDVGEADPPPERVAVEPPPASAFQVARFAIGAAAILALGASAAIGGFGLLGQTPPAAVEATGSPAQGVLAGAPSGAAEDASPSASASSDIIPSPSATPTEAPDDPAPTAAPIQTAGQPAPTLQRTPPPQPTGQPLPTAPPTPPPTASPQPTVPPPTPTESPVPSPTSPPPTPTLPPAAQCSDGLDNDGDALIDFGPDPLVNDPGCLSADDDDELLP